MPPASCAAKPRSRCARNDRAASRAMLVRRARRMKARVSCAAAAGLLIALLAMAYPAARQAASADGHFADAEDAALVALGRRVYMDACASCHGRALQGQPLWQL